MSPDGAVRIRTDREGIALLVVLLLTMVVAAIAAGAALIGANSFLINEYDQKIGLLEAVADAGLELGRARLNAEPGLFPPDSGYVALETDATVYDAAGAAIPGVTRSVYAGPIGGGPGEYGSYGAVIALAEDADGVRTVRRLDVLQSSFAAFAYFTDVEPSHMSFGSNDQLYGPVHSNSNIRTRESGATFHGPVTTAGVFEGAQYATFMDDTTSSVTPILMPTSAQFDRLRTRAVPGNMAFTATGGGTSAQSTMRIHFIARNVDGDPEKEGFIRVYESPDSRWLTGNMASGFGDYDTNFANTPNCGHFHADGTFRVAATDPDHSAGTALNDNGTAPGGGPSIRCFLGGADELWGGFDDDDGLGAWKSYPGTVDPLVAGFPDGGFLFPLDRDLNPAFRGVIHVTGKVVVSGTVRGRVTLAATDNIIIADDIEYDTDPGSGTCTDMLGLFSAQRIIVADNTLNAPQEGPWSSAWRTYDDTPDEFIEGALMALDQITVENYSAGSNDDEFCGATPAGRGCLRVTGGLIQTTRGPVTSGSGHGYIKSYTHDTCAFTDPPPYFPTTGHFSRSRYYEVDPIGFNAEEYFRALN